MCPDDTKQRKNEGATTTAISAGGTMMITDPISISISKEFVRSQDLQDDGNDEDNDILSKATPQTTGQSQTSIDGSRRTTNHSATTTTSTTFTLLRLTFCALGICTCYICYGIFHEKLLRSGAGNDATDDNTTTTSTSKKNFMGPSFILFTQCITNVIVAMIWQQIQSSIQQQQRSSSSIVVVQEIKPKSTTSDLPHRMLIITSLLYVCAMICSNEAIPHVSYPVAVLGKSCKLIPTMIIGQVISYSSKYLYIFSSTSSSSSSQMFQQIAHTRNEWIAAICICIGIVTFHFQSPSFQNHVSHDDNETDGDTTKNPRWGLYLLCTSLFMDGLLSVCQNILKKSKPRSPNAVETMYYINLYAVLFIGAFCYATGQFTWLYTATSTTPLTNDSVPIFHIQNITLLYHTMIRPYLSLIQHLCILNIAAACGQIFIFLTITWFTPVITTMITTTRKFITILLSVLLYGHSFTLIQWFCIIFIFVGLYIAIIGTTSSGNHSTSTTTKSTERQRSSTQKKTN